MATSAQQSLFEPIEAPVAPKGKLEPADTIELLNEARAEIRELYLDMTDPRPWRIGWSGGKDSSLVVSLVFGVMMSLPKEQRKRHVFVIGSDTGVENPIIAVYFMEQARLIQECADREGLPVTVKTVKRPLKDSYFVETIGRGYPLPHTGERRCTDKLKIQPQQDAVKDIFCSLVLTGVRTSESQVRNRRYKDKFDDGEYYPILFFTVENVWEALQAPLPWGSSLPIRVIYAEATGECGFRNPKGTEKSKVDACGARFGCWVCPVIQRDKSTEFLSVHYPWLEPLTRWRALHLIVYGHYDEAPQPTQTAVERKFSKRLWERINKRMKAVTKAGFMRNKKQLEEDEGCLIIEARKYLLNELLAAQNEMNELRAEEYLPPYQLIEPEEVAEITRQHEEDMFKRPFLTKKLTPQKIGEIVQRIQAEETEKLKMPYDPDAENLFTLTA